jgi:hypothetical protein
VERSPGAFRNGDISLNATSLLFLFENIPNNTLRGKKPFL